MALRLLILLVTALMLIGGLAFLVQATKIFLQAREIDRDFWIAIAKGVALTILANIILTLAK